MDDFYDWSAQPPTEERRLTHSGHLAWSPEDDKTLTELWPTHSSGEIAKTLKRTRSAVMGRVHRLCLAAKTVKKVGGDHKPRPRRKREPSRNTVRRQPTFETLSEPQGWSPIGVSLLDAEGHHCRSILASSAFPEAEGAMCCGHHIASEHFQFCKYHMELYTESRHRRRVMWTHWQRPTR